MSYDDDYDRDYDYEDSPESWDSIGEKWADKILDSEAGELFGEFIGINDVTDEEQGYFIAGNYSGLPENSFPDEGEPDRASVMVVFKNVSYEVDFSRWGDEWEVEGVSFRSGLKLGLDYCVHCNNFVAKNNLTKVKSLYNPVCSTCLQKMIDAGYITLKDIPAVV